MANIKFSEFTEAAAIGDIAFVVGYDGSTNKRILATDLLGNYLPLAGGTMTGNTLHGDNVKSIYGAGGDLEIYHTGTHSIIKDAGTGNLQLNAGSFVLNNSGDTQNMIIAIDGGATTLFCAGVNRLATTSTGITVAGNGIFSGNVGIGTTSPNEKLQVAGNIHAYAPGGVNAELAASTAAGSTTIAIRSSGVTHFNGGNVGIGTTAPGAKLQIGSATHAPSGNLANNLLQIKSASGFAYLTIGNGDSANATSYIGGASGLTVVGSVTDAGALSEYMRITNTGNVGIGTSSPSDKLSVVSTVGIVGDGTNQGLLKLYCEAGTPHYVGLKGPNHSGGSSYTLQLPNTLPNVANQILESNATGTLSWIATPSGGGGASSLNGLSDVALTAFTSALINIPAGGIGSYSFTMGAGAGNSMTTGAQSNTFIGYNAGNSNNGDNHVMIGAHAGERNAATVSFGNVMIGRYAGRGAVGSDAHSTIAIGESALEAVTGGDRNIAVGFHALRRLTTAGSTIAIGPEAGEFIIDKSDSVIIGYQAMENANSGQCVVIGSQANDTAVTNFGTGAIHIGYQAGRSSTGNRKINIGWTAGTAQTTGGGVNIGERAGASNTSSQGRVCVGGYSAQYNTGSSNTFIGEYSGQGISGSSNGGYNTTLGYKSMEDLTSAQYNTAVGINAGGGISTGSFNTILGGYSGNPAGKLTTGSYNVLLGVNAQGSTATVNNEVSIFNNSVFARFQGSAVAWSFVSDKRDKKDIKDLELGLDFVDKLKPRKFKWNLRSSDKDDGAEASGFIAQEIKETLDESGIDYTGIVNTDDPNQYTVAQANIIPMLVKAIQELKAEIEILKS
jgi:hypothetical protein